MFPKIILYILAFIAFFSAVYYVMCFAVNDEIKEVVSTTMREEFQLQEWKGNVFTNF